MTHSTFDPSAHMTDLKGRQYLQVMWRLVWFREDFPGGRIETELVRLDEQAGHAVFKATVTQIRDGEILGSATGYGSESVKDFRDYIEKAETKATGRALAMLGYGTQFAPEMDEGARIVDSPVGHRQGRQQTTQEPADGHGQGGYQQAPATQGQPGARAASDKQIKAIFGIAFGMGWERQAIEEFVMQTTGGAGINNLSAQQASGVIEALNAIRN